MGSLDVLQESPASAGGRRCRQPSQRGAGAAAGEAPVQQGSFLPETRSAQTQPLRASCAPMGWLLWKTGALAKPARMARMLTRLNVKWYETRTNSARLRIKSSDALARYAER